MKIIDTTLGIDRTLEPLIELVLFSNLDYLTYKSYNLPTLKEKFLDNLVDATVDIGRNI